MKKLFCMVLGLLSVLVMCVLVVMQINAVHPFLNLSSEATKMFEFVNSFGAMILVAGWSLVYFWGRGLKALFSVIVLIVIACGIVAFGFPSLITKVFGA